MSGGPNLHKIHEGKNLLLDAIEDHFGDDEWEDGVRCFGFTAGAILATFGHDSEKFERGLKLLMEGLGVGIEQASEQLGLKAPKISFEEVKQ